MRRTGDVDVISGGHFGVLRRWQVNLARGTAAAWSCDRRRTRAEDHRRADSTGRQCPAMDRHGGLSARGAERRRHGSRRRGTGRWSGFLRPRADRRRCSASTTLQRFNDSAAYRWRKAWANPTLMGGSCSSHRPGRTSMAPTRRGGTAFPRRRRSTPTWMQPTGHSATKSGCFRAPVWPSGPTSFSKRFIAAEGETNLWRPPWLSIRTRPPSMHTHGHGCGMSIR